jgi:hypothetical protein
LLDAKDETLELPLKRDLRFGVKRNDGGDAASVVKG